MCLYYHSNIHLNCYQQHHYYDYYDCDYDNNNITTNENELNADSTMSHEHISIYMDVNIYVIQQTTAIIISQNCRLKG